MGVGVGVGWGGVGGRYQSLIVSGVIGAWKTNTMKILMRHINAPEGTIPRLKKTYISGGEVWYWREGKRRK